MAAARNARTLAHRALTPLRRRYYVDGRAGGAVRLLPGKLRRKAGLDDASARGSRKIEIGGSQFPQPGYIHVDIDPRARHLEAVTNAWELPFTDEWADEIVAVHSLEHVPPPKLLPTLREWHRVLRPGGQARVHVPNTAQLTQSFLESDVEDKWRTMGAMLGMYCHPGVRSPDQLEVGADHHLMFDWPMLEWALREAGFRQVEDLTEGDPDRHTTAWREVVPQFSLVALATR